MSNFLIVDLECTCDSPDNFPRDEVEIIEIGGVIGRLSNKSFQELSRKQFYVHPKNHSQLTSFCSQLTGIEQHKIDSADDLKSSLLDFNDWIKDFHLTGWGSWGKFDFTQLKMECSLKNLTNPINDLSYINIKQGFARRYRHRVGLSRALSLKGLEFEGLPHSGLDDAVNIGRIIRNSPELAKYLFERVKS